MDPDGFANSLLLNEPPRGLSPAVEALWWDAKGDWTRAHDLVNELDENDAMCVHAYLHRKEGAEYNANYWYQRCGEDFRRSTLEEEWKALVEGLVR